MEFAAATNIADRKRADRASRIPTPWRLDPQVVEKFRKRPISIFQSPLDAQVVPGILSRREHDISSPNHDATDLLARLREGTLTCEEAVLATCKRAAIAQQLTNCLTEILFPEAIARARKLDAVPPADRGPLHGLPITVKDSFFISGVDSSIGISSLCYQPAQTNSMLVDILQRYGAIIIAKTTVPQTMLTADTDSVVFGRTCNAYKGDFGAGGSSGGEGVVVAMGGSAAGIGTDGAGSVRMPAFVNGIVGLRPSGYRWPLDGRAILGKGVMGTTAVGPVSVAGPLTRSVRDAQLILRLVSEARPWMSDPFLMPSPWLGLKTPKLRIGVWADFDHVHPLPPVARTFKAAQERLKAAGFELVPFAGPSIAHVWQLQKEWVEVQDLSYLRELLGKEPVTEIVRQTGIIYPPQAAPALTLQRLHDLNARTASLVRIMATAWKDADISCLLWIPAAHPAVPFDEYTDLTLTGLFNVLDWPAIVLPTGDVVDQRADSAQGGVRDADLFGTEDSRIHGIYRGYEADFESLPLSVQLIGRRGEDELLLAMAREVHEAVLSKSEDK